MNNNLGSCRLVSLPIDHLMAEMAAFPLASETAFLASLTHLDPKVNGSSFWRAAETALLGCFPAFSIDELEAIRDGIWFKNLSRRDESLRLVTYLRGLASDVLEAEGPEARPKLLDGVSDELPSPHGANNPYARARIFWRWLSFALPPDLLLAALACDHQPASVKLLSPRLAAALYDKEFAEIHQHLGAGLDFPDLWTAAMLSLGDPSLKADAFQSPGAVFAEGKELGPWFLRAALARYTLASFLHRKKQMPHIKGFSTFFEGALKTISSKLGWCLAVLFDMALKELRRAKCAFDVDFAELCHLYGQVAGVNTGTRKIETLEDLQGADPIAIAFPPQKGHPSVTPEMQFISSSLRYLEDNPQDKSFEGLFWQIVRVRNLFYRHVVQRPMTPGLQWFIRFYKRMKPAQKSLHSKKRFMVQSAARGAGLGRGLRSLEVRTSPEKTISEMHQTVIEVEKSFQDIGWGKASLQLECGLVLHLARERKNDRAHWRGSHADPLAWRDNININPTGYRYGTYYQKIRQEANTFEWHLRNFPQALWLVRGVDVCTDELGVPHWVVVPCIHKICQASQTASSEYYLQYGHQIPVLRKTIHIGEEFIHLLSGFRRIDEALRYVGLSEGERLGHAIALGIPIEEWSKRAGRIPVYREDRLLDLGWLWSFFRREGISLSGTTSYALEGEIGRLSRLIFDKELSPLDLEQLIEDLHSEKILRKVYFPEGPGGLPMDIIRGNQRLSRVYRYLTSPSIFDRGRGIEWVNPVSESQTLDLLQQTLRSNIAALGLAVEVNPSSNLLIGNMGDISSHPLFRLNPLDPKANHPKVNICIGSDDPLTFNTALPREYQLLWDTLILAGKAEASVHDWLEDVRACSLSHRFTLPIPQNVSAMFHNRK